MPILVGITLAVAVGLVATWVGLDRERGLYPIVVIVSASFYELFAVMGGTGATLIAEMIPFTMFLIVALLGFKKNLWLAVAALVGHGIFDFSHSRLIADPGVPAWWPMFCLSYDFAAALYLAWRLKNSSVSNVPVFQGQST
jgi:hypothetical protein